MGLPPTLVVDQVSSTNSWLAEQWRTGAAQPFASVRARFQTAGRGRFGRQWQAEPDTALLYSAIVTTHTAPTRIPLGAAIAVCNALEEPGLSVKWPNDVLLDGQKLAGILTEHLEESAGIHTLVLGIGVNLTSSPAQAAQLERDPDLLAAAITAQLHDLDALFEVYRQSFRPTLVRAVPVGAEPIVGTAIGVDESGALQVETDEGVVCLSAAEVTFEESE